MQPADGAQKRKKTRRGATIINSNYRYMGCSKVYGIRAVVPIDWRMQMLAAMDPQYTTIRTSRLDEVSTDQLIYIRTDIRPSLRIGATRANTKEDLVQMVDATAASKKREAHVVKACCQAEALPMKGSSMIYGRGSSSDALPDEERSDAPSSAILLGASPSRRNFSPFLKPVAHFVKACCHLLPNK